MMKVKVRDANTNEFLQGFVFPEFKIGTYGIWFDVPHDRRQIVVEWEVIPDDSVVLPEDKQGS